MNIEKYNLVFSRVLNISIGELPGLCFKSIRLWDSIGHMGLVAAIEEEFDISLEPEDIIAFQSYEKGIAILEKYGVKF